MGKERTCIRRYTHQKPKPKKVGKKEWTKKGERGMIRRKEKRRKKTKQKEEKERERGEKEKEAK